ncbi:MAG: type I restriction enzyme HsdR N-terminal domain-containing protein [Methanimicrococcus sp.]|nr:type I restriction enzyme HsdR N-terminal domain-containing protein [Methanimicrococcus sp.]
MDLIDELRQFSTRVATIKSAIKTEEATKLALVLPFFELLGYDIRNPLEFEPEYAANFGVKKDARVDYAIIIDKNPIILIECKPCDEDLEKHAGQLFQYFAATTAKFGILTNGIIYQFYTDINETNKMDKDPFLVFDILDFDENIVPELKRFAKKTLDIDAAFNAAAELKYMGKIKELLSSVRTEPQDSFVKYVMAEIYDGKATTKAIEKFRPIIRRGFNQYINDAISGMLQNAIKVQSNPNIAPMEAVQDEVPISEQQAEEERITTLEEFEAFAIVKSIAREICDVNRLTYQHTRDYTVVLFDNHTWKRICRFWFNRKQKYITIPDENKNPVRYDISNLNDIYEHADKIKEVCKRYL